MKNFTKQFTNKTLFKPTRWLLVALMFLLGTASAWAFNQSAVDLYFDDSEAKWSDNSKSPYVYIGHSTWTACYGPFTRVSGTQYLFKLAKANFNNGGTWNGASAWVICNEKWWDTSGESIDKFTWHGDKNVTQKRTTAWSASYIYKTNGTASTTSDNHTIQAYKTTTVSNSNYTVTINSATGGTLTVKDYDNNTVSNGASKIYLTVLKFSASASSGYTFKEVQINNGSTTTTISAANLGSTTYTLKSAVTITPVWEKTCTPPAAPTLNPNSTTVCSGTSFDLPSGYRWYTVATGGTKLSSNTISAGVTEQTKYYAEAGEDGCVSTSRTAYTVNVDPKSALELTEANPTICQGSSIVLSNYVESSTGTVKWYSNSGMSTEITNPSEARTPQSSPAYYYARATSGVCSNVDKTLTVTFKSAPTKPVVTLSPADGNIISGNSATLTVTQQTNVTFTLYKDGESTGETGNSFAISESGTYYVIGTDECGQDSPASDSKTITVCTIGSTLNSAEYDAATQKVSLEGTFEFCGKESFHGFQWKKVGSNWCDENDPTENSDYVALGRTTEGGTKSGEYTIADQNSAYVFRTYVVPVGGAWIYGNEITVTPCINIATPDIDPVAICAGSTATLTLKNKQNGVTYKIDSTPIFTDGNTHTVKPNGTTTYTITATSAISCDANQKETATVTVTVNAMPSLSPSATVTSICEGETKTIRINTNATSIKWYKNETLIEGQTTASLSITTAGTYKVVVSNASGCSKEMSFTVANAFGSDITPTITGSASVQSGATGIIYSTANVDGAAYEWQLPTGWTFSGTGNQITVSVPDTDGNGTITVRITKNSCTKTATLDVAWMDGFTVYLRRPHAKDETTQYNYWFEKSTAAGPGYIKFGTVKATPSDAEVYVYNGGSGAETAGDLGTKGTESFTDCDGYVWDAYNIGIDVTALYFHAPNDKSTNGSTYGGYATYTRSYSQNTPISSDLYFTMGNWTNQQKGRTLTKVEKPFEGIEIEALGDTEICSNNMASFAALYLKSNCTGQEITAYAWKYSANNSSWDEYTTGKGANTNNIRPNKAGYYHLECELKDGSVVTSNSIQITTTTCSISNASLNNITSNLPIIMVNTGDNEFPSVSNGKHCSASADDLKKKRSVDVKILWNPSGTVSSSDAYTNGANLYYDRKARMNYRGSSSLNFEKKSYAFCPGDENCGQDDDKSADYVKTKKMNMFGIGEAEDKDWVLYAAYVDPSMMRNILAMETYSAMTGKWGVKNKYVELYIDGEYQGVYVFMDKVTQNKKRVNVKWDVKDDTKREFILKFDKTDAADRYSDSSGDQKTFESDMTGKTGISTYDTEVDQRFEIEYPEKEDIEDDGGYWSDVYSFVLGKVNEFESALSKGDFTTVRNLINYESWADFFIINEFTKNMDAYRASCIFVYTGGKFEAWPLWDYELSFNNTVTGNGKGRGDHSGLLIEHSDVYSDAFPAPFWWTGKYNGSNMYSGLLKDPCFVQMIKSRWAEHTKTGGALNPDVTTAKTAAYKANLDKNGAATREFTKWPVNSRGKDACNGANTGYFANGGGGSNTTYANSYSQLNSWLDANARIKGLQTEIDNLAKIIEFGITSTVDKDETTPWRAVNVTVDAVGADYTYTVTPEIIEGQVIQGSDNLLIYAEPATLPQTYTVVTTLNAKDQCGGKDSDNASSTVTFTVNDLVDNCEE